jgi:hypothetical protein
MLLLYVLQTEIKEAIRMNGYTIYQTMLKSTTVSLLAANWVGDTIPYSQVININGVDVNSKIDLQPTAVQIVELQNEDVSFVVENDNGVVTVYALGGKPESDYSMQALISEVLSV